jgi:hypothetical protein
MTGIAMRCMQSENSRKNKGYIDDQKQKSMDG